MIDERMARLLCRCAWNKAGKHFGPAWLDREVESRWHQHIGEAEALSETHAILPREPTEADLERVALGIWLADHSDFEGQFDREWAVNTLAHHPTDRERYQRIVRAAYRAAVEGGE